MKIVAAKKLLKANDQLAQENRARFNAAGVLTVNLLGSPGSGKTTLLEALLGELREEIAPGVIEGDIAGSIDAQRIEALGIPVVQINTEGACHLDASMIAAAVQGLDLEAVRFLTIENIGNLVCPAGFDLGEHLRLVVLSVSEGDDKVVKYPAIFQTADAVVVTKADLLGFTNFKFERVAADVERLAPQAEIFEVAALKGTGIEAVADFIRRAARKAFIG